MKKKKSTWFVIILLFVVGSVYLYLKKDLLFPPKDEHDFPNPILKIGALAPNLILKDIEGKIVNLKEYRGKVVLINFWASWCPPCLEEMPALAAIYQKLRSKGFEILAISLDDKIQNAIDFVKKEKLPFKVFMDPEGKSAQEYLVYGLPYTVLLDREGKVLFKIFGGHEWDRGKELERIQSLL